VAELLLTFTVVITKTSV